MKRWLILVFFVVVMFSLVACDDKDNSTMVESLETVESSLKEAVDVFDEARLASFRALSCGAQYTEVNEDNIYQWRHVAPRCQDEGKILSWCKNTPEEDRGILRYDCERLVAKEGDK